MGKQKSSPDQGEQTSADQENVPLQSPPPYLDLAAPDSHDVLASVPSRQDQAQPLEKEVTESPRSQSANATVLTPQEIQALQTEPEIDFELDIKETDILEDYFISYTQESHHVFQKWLKRAEPYLPYIRKVFTEHGLPQDLVFLPFAESGFNPMAYSRSGAAGMWQFMPATGRMFGLESDWWIDERRDPYKSTRAAAEFLKKLYAQFDDWYLVLAAYNAGDGHVARAMRRSGQSDYFDLADKEQLHNETCRYVPKFLAVLKIVRNLEKLGFEPLNWDESAEPDSVTVPPGTDLTGLADAAGLSWSRFKALNPAFRRSAAPPDKEYHIYLPDNKLAAAQKYISQTKHTASKGVHRYRIRSGDSWWQISKRFDIPLAELKKFNQTSSDVLRPGEWVLIPGAGRDDAQDPGAGTGSGYMVKSGDTVWGIAQKLGISVTSLKEANPEIAAARLPVGKRLKLPGQATTRRIASSRSNYEVRSGDTLWSIARRFDLSLSSLVQANGLNQDRPLKVGTKLYIPDMNSAQQAQARQTAQKNRTHYQVKKGDNVWSIARKFGVSAQKVLKWNKLSSRDVISPGDTLTIYR
ncbi:MAG: LysM peptidoglycan-binding domain-containing protein [Desulfovermiculus sp.]